MKIDAIKNNCHFVNTNIKPISYIKSPVKQNNSDFVIPNTYNYPQINKIKMPITINFLGYPVHIVDGGHHAANMQHFIKAICNDADVEMHEVETNPNSPNIKQLKSLEETLKFINNRSSLKDEFIAIPALASVPLLNIQDQYNRIMPDNVKLTPENMKTNKECLLKFLKAIYEYPDKYRKYINYMDSTKQGIEYTYGVIQQINKLKEKGAKVYVPSGHPHDETLKWMAKEKGLSEELYHFIATGEDVDCCIEKLHNEIKEKNWYNFNLLTLSDADIVGIKDAKGAQDYMFAAYDSCITNGQRGVYNFSPVWSKGYFADLLGYSYTDTETVQYPYNEFPANDKISNISYYVGRDARSIIADGVETAEFLKDKNPSNHSSYLYEVKDVFTKNEIKRKKIDLQGKYVDSTLKLFFDVNKDGKIIFPKCDCEGSGKPSVLSMWGSCFAVFNAINQDIELMNERKNHISEVNSKDEFYNKLKILLDKSDYHNPYKYQHLGQVPNPKIKKIDLSKKYLEDAIQLEKITGNEDGLPYLKLGFIFYKENNYDSAAACLNNGLNMECREVVEFMKNSEKYKTLDDIKIAYEKYYKLKSELDNYERDIKEYNDKGFLHKLLNSPPEKPESYEKYEDGKEMYGKIFQIENALFMLGMICFNKREYYPAKVCEEACRDIINFLPKGLDVIKARANNLQYIGNIYPDIKPKDHTKEPQETGYRGYHLKWWPGTGF